MNERLQEKLDKTNQAISEYCTENTVKKIELATGWQFGSEETEKINSSLSDKELIEQQVQENLKSESTNNDKKSTKNLKNSAIKDIDFDR